jgi:septal ring factor EnvC (AmiA/AmiB activator)
MIRAMPTTGSVSVLLRSLFLIVIAISSQASIAVADDGASAGGLGQIRKQIEQIKTDESSERRRFEMDEQRIRELERQLQQIDAQNRRLSSAAQEFAVTNDKLKTDTDQRIHDLQ